MNGPQLVCAGCQKPTTLTKPVCDDCMRAAGVEPVAHCVLCEAALYRDSAVLPAERGVHKTRGGGYAGRCTR